MSTMPDSGGGGNTSALITYTTSGKTYQSAGTTAGKNYDFLDLLGVAQRFKLDFHSMAPQNVANLEGICWDVDLGGEKVWPVLVFEKSRYGDLNNFMVSSSGKALDFKYKVELLFGIADAVRTLHSAGRYSESLI